MFIPTPFREDDKARLYALMRRHEFATLVTVREGRPEVTHLPVLLDTSQGEHGTLRAHLARANTQWENLSGDQEVLVIFQGPHAYISPAWYAHHPAVPTWNYAAVHAWGMPRLLDDVELHDLLRETSAAFEPDLEAPWAFDRLPPEYVEKMARGVVGFEMPIVRLEGKFKLSQNRPADDQIRAAEALSRGDELAQETARLMRENQERRP